MLRAPLSEEKDFSVSLSLVEALRDDRNLARRAALAAASAFSAAHSAAAIRLAGSLRLNGTFAASLADGVLSAMLLTVAMARLSAAIHWSKSSCQGEAPMKPPQGARSRRSRGRPKST